MRSFFFLPSPAEHLILKLIAITSSASAQRLTALQANKLAARTKPVVSIVSHSQFDTGGLGGFCPYVGIIFQSDRTFGNCHGRSSAHIGISAPEKLFFWSALLISTITTR